MALRSTLEEEVRSWSLMDSPNADDFLIEEVRAGHQNAWRQLIERYHGRLMAFARARVASHSDAEDLVQDTFVGFLQSLGHFDPSRSLETYLFTILRYKLYDLLRQRKLPLQQEPFEAEDWWDRVVPGSNETPSQAAVIAEATEAQQKLLRGVLRELIHDYRDRDAFKDLQVIELVFFAGMRNLDVGELLEIDQKAVAGIKFRAIQKLQKFLADREPAQLGCLEESEADLTVARVWRNGRLTCLKRSTLGSYLMGVVDEPWRSYIQFHLDVVACPMCVANYSDLESEQEEEPLPHAERFFQSSVGFLSRRSQA